MSEHRRRPLRVPRFSWYRPMRGRTDEEEGRAATPLELLFDLCFVVAVAQAGSRLEHAVVEGHFGAGLLGFGVTFFAIWWAWMNFTWFASAYDTDDVPYRIATLVQIAGVLVLAAGVPRAFDQLDLTVPILGYAVMRTALVAQWLRAAAGEPDGGRRSACLRYAGGIGVAELAWLVWLFLPESWQPWWFLLGVLLEVAVPVAAERRAVTPWHTSHISERYGLFTIIVLGESISAATRDVQEAVEGEVHAGFGELTSVIAGGLLIVFSMWWQYFALPAHAMMRRRAGSLRSVLAWGYGHVLVFAGAAAVGPGLVVAAHQAIGGTELTQAEAGSTVTVPVAVYVLAVEYLQLRPFQRTRLVRGVYPCCAVAVLGATWTPEPVLVTGVLLACALLVAVAGRVRAQWAPG
nr:low temperature requirement protein A [Streptomyces xiaopingdaonensis]